MKCKILLIKHFNGHTSSITPNTKRQKPSAHLFHIAHLIVVTLKGEEQLLMQYYAAALFTCYSPVYIWTTLLITDAEQVSILCVSLHCTHFCLHVLESVYNRKMISS